MNNLNWAIMRHDERNEPIIKNQYGCVVNCGVGNSPNGSFCGECNCPKECEFCKEN